MKRQLSFQAGSTLDPEQSVYVRRAEDDEYWEIAKQPKSWINISGCRMMGKSSLYTKHIAPLRKLNIHSVVVDIGAEVGEDHDTASKWFRQLAHVLATRLRLDQSIIGVALASTPFDAAAGTVVERLFREILARVTGRLLLILDEYDTIANLPFCEDLLEAFRHIEQLQRRSRDPDLDRLSICLVGLQRLFQLGRPGGPGKSIACHEIIMRDFDTSPQTIRTLLEGFHAKERPDSSVIESVLSLSGGQPLVTIELLREVFTKKCRTPIDVEAAAFHLVAPSGLGNDIQLFTNIDEDLTEIGGNAFVALRAYDALLEGSEEAHTAPGTKLLILYGLVRQEGAKLTIKGRLFRRRFDHAWVDRALSRAAGGSRLQQHRGPSRTNAKRICVINTGGTLGMVQRGRKVVPPRDAEEFKAYFASLHSIAKTVEFINLFKARDSINVFPDQWVTVAEYIYRRRHDGFDGFVVAHGTDTMAYTASAVAFALGRRLRFPVVFTGAQTTPDVAYGDAHVNLYRACEVAKHNIPEVVISFGNFVYRAVRAQKKDDRRFDGFESPTYPALAEITGEINVRTELLRRVPRGNADITLNAEFERSILIVPQFPGLEPGFFERLLNVDNMQLRCKGVIVQTLGAGNVTSEAPYSFIPFVRHAHAQGIPVIVTSQYPPDPGTHTKYTPAQAPIEAGAIHAGNMTLAAAVTKFRWVLANVRKRKTWARLTPDAKRDLVAKLMVEHPIIGEF